MPISKLPFHESPAHTARAHARPVSAGAAPSRTLLIRILFAAALLLTAAESPASPPQATTHLEGKGVSIELLGDPAALRRRRLERWLPTYRREMPPLLDAVGRLRRSIGSSTPQIFATACRNLGRALAQLDRDALLPAPEFALHRHLTTALHHLARTATACLARRPAFVTEFEHAQRELAHTSAALRRVEAEP